MKRSDFAGLGQVYRFTLFQQLKNKANMISLAILLVMCLVSMPLVSVIGDGYHLDDMFAAEELTAIILNNETDLPLETVTEGAAYNGAAVTLQDVETLAPKAARVTIAKDAAGYVLRVEGGAELDSADLNGLALAAQGWLQTAQMDALGLDAETANVLLSGVHLSTGTAEEYLHPEEEDALGFDLRFLVTYVYAIAVMILCTYAATYIVRIIVEEKAFRLVELLMVSVQPLALVLGKILAMMTYIFGMFAAMAGCIFLSWQINDLLGGTMAVMETVGVFDLSLLRLDAGTIGIVVISLLLAYAAFSLLAGLAGTCCSRNEDVEAATGTVMITVMAGYLVSCITAAIPGSGLSVFLALCPVVNVFCAPAQYVTGNIGLGWLIASWVEQALIVAALAWLTARVYRQLILSRGSRIKLRQLLAMAKEVRA